ncbi:tetraspanin-36-like [Physella acuta]|uniref:tetraspanin-36-like n=1 Tax=Physella acuta TaxID=109671 RepID=UPI0027DBD1B6|nr:tetraspanin-36-like [Physella acuta]XP_059140732.1 tetraspanin-36-like [Physella acuta]
MARDNTMCSNLAKGILMFTGVCYLISAGCLSYIGIWVFSTYDHFDEIADASLTLLPASIILGVSVVMCIIGILACIAAFKNNKVLLSVFFCLILLVFVGEVLAGVLGYIYRKKVEGILEDDLMEAIDKYNILVNKEQIDYMQTEFECCGVRNATDWEKSAYWKQNHTKEVPLSCCKTDIGNATCSPILGSSTIFNKGCLNELNDQFRKNLVYIATSVVFLAVIQLLALISTCILVCRTRSEHQYHTLNEVIGGGLRV